MQPSPDSDKSTSQPQLGGGPTASVREGGQSRHPEEIGGRLDGLEPTRFGDWEKNGRCIDF